MKQLELNFIGGKKYIPTFDTWYAENSHERRQFGERPYSKKQAVRVYSELLESGFFLKSQYRGNS